MGGFSSVTNDETIMYADNASFDGTKRDGKLSADGEIWIGSSVAPHVRKGTITGTSGVTITPGNGTIQIGLSGGGAGIDSFTPDSGTSPVVPDSNGLVTMAGSGSITTVGGANSLTTQLTGLTAFNVLVGAGTSTITKVAPSATSGVPLISQGAASNPAFGTAVVAGGGTGRTTLTNHGVLVGAGTGAITQLAVGATGTVLAGSTGNDPSFTASPALTSVTLSGGTALSSYSSGTFTPSYTGSGSNPTVTYINQLATYVKVGNLVSVNVFPEVNTYTGGAGDLRISGLPFTATAGLNYTGACYGTRITFSGQIAYLVVGGTTYMNVVSSSSTAVVSLLQVGAIPNTATAAFNGSACYYA